MIGQAVSLTHKNYNIIILAAGAGTRMGHQSEYIPKALSKLGHRRAIDYIIDRYQHVAHKFIIGCGHHADLLFSYIKGQYPFAKIEFSLEDNIVNNAISTLYCLDYCDSRVGTIVVFCDLIMVGNMVINGDTIYYTNKNTKGKKGTFRHSCQIVDGIVSQITEHDPPTEFGVLGNFIFSDTIVLKKIVYQNYSVLKDLTNDIVEPYSKQVQMHGEQVECVYEFGNENDLNDVRKMWENV